MNSDTAPTKTVQDLVRVLKFRESLGTSYVSHAPRGRAVLVVPTTLTSRRLERLRALSWKTVRAAIASGLVEVPDGRHEIAYGYRQRGEGTSGEVICLTDAGRAFAQKWQVSGE